MNNNNDKSLKKAVILTAGKGTRMLPLTAAIPKALLPVGKKPAVQIVAEEAINAGATELCFVVCADGIVKKHFEFLKDNSQLFEGVKTEFVVQHNTLGSGDALMYAKDFCFKDSFFVLNCDDLFDKNACKTLLDGASGHQSIGVSNCAKNLICRFGVVLEDEKGFVKTILEKPRLNEIFGPPRINVGRYIFEEEIFYALMQSPVVNGELRLTEGINLLATNNALKSVFLPQKRFDAGSMIQYCQAFCFFLKEIEKT